MGRARILVRIHTRRDGELSETLQKVDLINVHELGTPKTKNPKEVAKHASFMAANMLVVVGKHVRVGTMDCRRCSLSAFENLVGWLVVCRWPLSNRQVFA